MKSNNLDVKHSSSKDMDLQIKKKIYANLGNTGKDYGKGKNKKLMGVKAMSTMVRKKTLERQASLARSTMGESIKIDATRGTAMATSEY